MYKTSWICPRRQAGAPGFRLSWPRCANSSKVRLQTDTIPFMSIGREAVQVSAPGIAPDIVARHLFNLHSSLTSMAIQDAIRRTNLQATLRAWLRLPTFRATSFRKPGRILALMHGTTPLARKTLTSVPGRLERRY